MSTINDRSVKQIAADIWAGIGETEIEDLSDLRSGRAVTPAISSTLREVIIATVHACANEIERGGTDASLRQIAGRLERTRYHLLYPDLREVSNGE